MPLAALGGRKRGRPPKNGARVKALVPVLQVLYGAPAYLGYGAHWALADDEASLLAQHVTDAFATLPPSQAKYFDKLSALLEKLFPWITLGSTVYFTTATRVHLTRELLAHARESESQRGPAASGNTPAADVSDDARTNGRGPTASGHHPTYLDGLFHERARPST